MGSAVDAPNLTRELERYSNAGWGGVHLIPIYGAKGYEARYLDYLSPGWMAMLHHAAAESKRLGMGLDMTTGTGWCFGGPNISGANACTIVVPKIEGGKCTVSYRLCSTPVKRAAPGGAGPMLNPFARAAISHYLVRFTQAFTQHPGPGPRAMYHDSFEYGANWSSDMFEQFARRRGYRLEDHLDSLFGNTTSDQAARVKSDYRETLSDAMVEDFIPVWVSWCHDRKILTRNQAHGSPGNLLDLYGAVDIPETEMFYKDRSTLVSKFASSAAHVMGRRLVASESGTWLREHFQETLAALKDVIDQLWLAGVNHIIYHGTCYSTDDAPWPGWLFYASTQMNPRNPIWRDVPALNAYIARSQSLLQQARPANDILLYWPIYDMWYDPKGLNINMTVHHRAWVEGQPVGRLAQRLLDRGYTFDLISDRQLLLASSSSAGLSTPGSSYRVLAVPSSRVMPLSTLRQILKLALDGATVLFEDQLPSDVPGLASLEQRRAELKSLLSSVQFARSGAIHEARLGSGRILAGPFEDLLAAARVHRESMVDNSLHFVRQSIPGGTQYFIANRGTNAIDGWIPLATTAQSAAILDPTTGSTGLAAYRGGAVYLQLLPGQSLFVKSFSKPLRTGRPWAYWMDAAASVPLQASWKVRFLAGGPVLPAAYETRTLDSWTLHGPEAERFGGTVLYSASFDAPAGKAQAWFLNLGQVRESARVRCNGRELATIFSPPHRILLPALKPKANQLEIEVTNLAANRIRDMDRRKIPWRTFHDVNLVNIDYKPFDASVWPVFESGLLGPVTLEPAQHLEVR
jgi:hypothetical protein